MKNPASFAADRVPTDFASIRDCPEPVPVPLCRAHLDKIAGSVTFGRAEQLRNFLQWLGERSLADRPSAPSEKEIAAAVMNRKDFDPQADSLVRKEMSRLREKLSRYYMSEGRQDEIRVTTGGGYLLGFIRPGNVNRGTSWLVLPFRSNPEMADHVEQLLEEILFGLYERGKQELVAPTTALNYRGRAGDVRIFAAECRADFVVEGSLRRRDNLIEATVWLVDGQSGHARRSRRIIGSDASDVARLATGWLVEDPAE